MNSESQVPPLAKGNELLLLLLFATFVGLHVVLHGVQCAQHQVKDADVDTSQASKGYT